MLYEWAKAYFDKLCGLNRKFNIIYSHENDQFNQKNY